MILHTEKPSSAEVHDVSSDYPLGEIALTDGHKAFGVTRALDGVTLKARRGEIHAVVGENGCGKSTVAKVLSGVLPLDKGNVSVFGETPATPQGARKLGIATVFQEILVANEASIVENLFIGSDTLWTKSLPTKQKKDAAAKIMEELAGRPIDPDLVVGTLPLSDKQWIVIARALLREPKVLILDESSAALDLDATERLFNKMRELRDAGSAVFVVTHRIAELVRISDRATVLRDGRTAGVLEKGDITERNLLQLMTGEAPVTSAAERPGAIATSDQVVMKTDRLRILRTSAPIRFDVRQGEIVGVAGLDGQGQDEFVRVLSGLASAHEGFPEVQGTVAENLKVTNLDDAVEAGVAYVSGDRKREGLLPNLSIYENLLIAQYRRHHASSLFGLIRWSTLKNIFDREVERFSIKIGDKSNRITSLSGGNQQKVMIGRAFALKPRILILNDPARGIDVGSKGEIYRQLREYASHGNSVVYLSTEIEEFIGFCSRVLVFRDHSVFDAFEGQEIDTHRILEAMFGQTPGIGGASRPESLALESTASVKDMKIVEFGKDKKMVTKDDIGPIKIKDFGREESDLENVSSAREETHGKGRPEHRQSLRHDEPHPPRQMKIIDYDQEYAEKKIREKLGPMKIIDVDQEATREKDREWRRTREMHESGIGKIKIVESDA